jgi:hypothetical protein
MKLHIKKNKPIWDIQKEFNGYFPYLKIIFFKWPYINKTPSFDKKIAPHTRLNQLAEWRGKTEIEFNQKMTTSEFRTMIAQQLGLYIQMLKKSGRIWIDIPLTDDWTLEQQNDEAKIMSSIHVVDKQVDWS